MIQFNRTSALTINNDLVNLRVNFHIEKEMSSSGTSKCELKLYNMSPTHRKAVEAGGTQLTLLVGYGGQNQLLYSGKIQYAFTERVGSDLITTCQMLPGATVLTTPVHVVGAQDDFQVYQAVMNQLALVGIAKGYLSQAVKGVLQGNHWKRPFSETGTAEKFLDLIKNRGISSPIGSLHWAAHDGQLNFYADGEYQDPTTWVISATTGMIGMPTALQPPGNFKVRVLLNAELNFGKKVQVQSSDFPINGFLKVNKSTHVGDTLEGDWYSELELAQLGTHTGFQVAA